MVMILSGRGVLMTAIGELIGEIDQIDALPVVYRADWVPGKSESCPLVIDEIDDSNLMRLLRPVEFELTPPINVQKPAPYWARDWRSKRRGRK